jgi:hypothetical protein
MSHHHSYLLLILFKSFRLLKSNDPYIVFSLSSFKIDEYNILLKLSMFNYIIIIIIHL